MNKENIKAQKNRINDIILRLRKEYPDSKCSLIYNSPFQLLVATILSAQCTDERVNQVTPILFKKANTAIKMTKVPKKTIYNMRFFFYI